jgi:CheY-specific phosphatase CheX
MSKNPPPNLAFNLMADHLSQAALELFADYDVAIQRSPAAVATTDAERSGVAVIGYAGQGVRGALILVPAESAIRAWMAAAGVTDGEVTDTLGEFSNMLLGRLKGRLLGEGMSILAATPTTASGAGLRLSAPPAQSTSAAFDGPGWQVSLRLDATFAPGFELPVFCQVRRPAQAGEAILFETQPEESEP